jgi:hypothetical protein
MTDQTEPQTEPLELAGTSREKVEGYMRQAAQVVAGDGLGAAAVAMLPMILSRLPEDPDVLDELLVRYAALLLHLRSDGTAELHIAAGPVSEAA